MAERTKPRYYGAKVFAWGAAPSSGIRSVDVEFPTVPVRVRVEPRISEGCDHAVLQAEIDSTAEAIATALHSVSSLQDAADSANERARMASANAQNYAQRLAAVLGEKRRLGGPAMVRPEGASFDGGPVWLLDPVRQCSGMGIRFAGLADLWIEWPDMRPIDCGSDEQGPWMLVDQFVMPLVPLPYGIPTEPTEGPKPHSTRGGRGCVARLREGGR